MTFFHSRVRKVKLCASAEYVLSLISYPAGLVQPHHAHEGAQMSVLLAGDFREQSPFSDIVPSQRVSALKSAGASHAVTFGRHGALMLSIDVADDLDVPLRKAGDWRPLTDNANALAVAVVMEPDCRDLLADLVVEIRHASLPHDRRPPDAVRRLKQALDDAPSQVRIIDIAKTVDIHRVHLSRAFTAAYGVSPSLYRRRRMTGHAISLACHEALPLSHAAAEAGFADQSHLARSLKRDIGISPTRLRRLFDVTSVQDVAAGRG